MIRMLIFQIIFLIIDKKNLKKCLLKDSSDSKVESFEYKGKLYDKEKYISVYRSSLRSKKTEDLISSYTKLKKQLPNSKYPGYTSALIEVYRRELLEDPAIKSTRMYGELTK